MTPADLARATPERPIRVGRYDVTGFLGAGGMGTVYAAVDVDHGTRVALKTLQHLGGPSLLRFKKEFRLAADLAHPNLVSLYELSCHDDLWFFTMERIHGTGFIASLRGEGWRPAPTAGESTEGLATTVPVVKRVSEPRARATPRPAPALATPPPSVPQLRDAFAQLVRGVAALHDAGLLHLDLKPSNVLVDRSGRVAVVDFGLVRGIEERAAQGERGISGTPLWMAPEQYGGGAVDAAADWYAVGAMLYLALTGVMAFAPGSLDALFRAKHGAPPPPPESLLPDLPADLCSLCMALLSADPAQRPSRDAVTAALVGGARGAVAGPRRARPSVVGRDVERARLADAFRRVREGGTAVVHLVGPSGVGKTTLLDGLVDDAESDALVLRGRCYERESVPYKAFDGMVDGLAARLSHRRGRAELPTLPPWIAELSHVFPVLATVPSVAAAVERAGAVSASLAVTELRRRAVLALRELVVGLAAAQPLVLAIDDLHWADADSTVLLLKLLEPPAPRGLMIVASYRRAEAVASTAIAPYLELVRSLDARVDAGEIHRDTIDVGPLRRADAERLAVATLKLLGAPTDGLPARIAAAAAGNPFYVEELAHHAADARAASGGAVDVGWESVLARRVESLGADERALVEVLAVANTPVPLSVSFAAAGLEAAGVRRALWSLGGGHFVRSTGSSAADRAELHHDGMREAVLRLLAPERAATLHLALGRALRGLAADADGPERDAWLFAAVRHLNQVAARLDGDERTQTAALDLEAGRRARRAAAFPLAFACFHAGTELLPADAATAQLDLALALHGGAAETAYLSAAWGELDAHVAWVKAHGPTILEQLVAWEVQIDACIARRAYDEAVDAGVAALALLGVELPARPTMAEVGAEVERAVAALARVGPTGLVALPDAADAHVAAAMRLQTRISSAAYFARPLLFPVLACRLVAGSVEHGLSAATPYALSVFGIVLNTLGAYRESHAWGRVALELVSRFEDRSLEARTRHVVHDLVDVWTVPLASTLDDLRGVVEIGKETGDLEYAAYAAHAYVHNAFYAGRELEGLLVEALAFGTFMRGYEQVNALHVHAPFEQVLRCFTGRTPDPACLNGDGFDERDALEVARASGSRSAQCLVPLLMGLVRYHFGSPADASACLEQARPFLDGVVSTWHQPIFHQYAALAIHALPADARAAARPDADASLAALRALAAAGEENFGHKVALIEAASALADGDARTALDHCRRALDGAEPGGFRAEVGLAHEVAARAHAALGDEAAAARAALMARSAYEGWGAAAKTSATRRTL